MKSKIVRGSFMKRCASFIMIFLMVFGILPWQDMNISFAADPVVKNIEILRQYQGNYDTPSLYYLKVLGTDLNTLTVSMEKDDGSITNLVPSSSAGDGTWQQYTISISNEGSKFYIGGKTYNLAVSNMPQIKSVQSTLVKSGGTLTLSGVNLNQIDNGIDTDANGDGKKISVKYGKGNDVVDISPSMYDAVSTEKTKSVTITSGLGSQYIDVLQSYTEGTVDVNIKYRYLDAFRIYDEINIDTNNIIIYPNKAKAGDTVTISTPDFPAGNYFVFLVRNEKDPLLGINLGQDIQLYRSPDKDDNLTFKIPSKIGTGPFQVILTNKVDGVTIKDDTNFTNSIIKQKNIGVLTVVDGTLSPVVQTVNPPSGPDTGSEVQIYGKYFEELNIDGLTDFDDDNISAANGNVSLVTRNDTKQLKITYPNATYYGKTVTVTRYISVIIGGAASFEDAAKQNFSKVEFDHLTVKTKGLDPADKDTKKDVQVNIETLLEETPVPAPPATKFSYTIYESAIKADGYEYIPTFTEPTIDSVTPDTIIVKNEGGVHKTSTDVILAIKGKDFKVYKKDESITYPKVIVGVNNSVNDKDHEIVLRREGDKVYGKDGNLLVGATLEVLDAQGNIVDGTVGNETGTKIIIRIPKGVSISYPKVNTTMQSIGIANPIRGSLSHGPVKIKNDAVKFLETEDVPVIEEVKPNVVTVNGGEDIEVTGSNFKDGIKVFIDGEEVPGVKREGDGKKLTFKAPKGREGDTLIYVINPSNGGSATYPFKYVLTYTEPKIIDFSPKTGKTGTLVVVKGQNLLKPDPTALEKDILKLVGTRVLLEGKDINEYNLDSTTKEIKLQSYTAQSNNKIFEQKNNKLILGTYYHSIILKDTSGKFFTIDVDVKGNPILSNGVDQKYTIDLISGVIKAYKDGGGNYDVSITTESGSDVIQLNLEGTDATPELKLTMMTPFIIKNGVITGDNVRVVSSEELYFTVPILESDGYYDLTIQNPDTKKDSKLNENGFYYYRQPTSKPNIQVIEPSEGSVDGGYVITIKGNKIDGQDCFIDNGTEKTKVFINGYEVSKDQVKISTDGLSIEAVVPKLDVDLRAKYNTDRLTVPVVVVNPDGGSASKEDGFTYVVPSSHPQITKITPQKGEASGNKIVEITGKDFRFFEPYNDADRSQSWSLGEDYQDLNGYKILFDGVDEAEDGTNTKGPDDLTNKKLDDLKKLYTNPADYSARIETILPKVYFGGKQAEIIEFSNGYIKVKTPKGENGSVDVYLVNNDAGISNKVSYTYESSTPKIDTIIPAQGKKQGNDKIEINGSGFEESNIKVYTLKEDNTISLEDKKQALVRFGDISNKDIARELENSGLITNSRTTVNLDGNLTVAYDGENHQVTVSVKEGDNTYSRVFDYNDEAVYVPTNLLVNTKDSSLYDGYELISLKVEDRRLLVERGYSPSVEYKNEGKLIVYTSSYHTVGTVPVTVINPDGGEAGGEFEYTNPDSYPQITELTKDGEPSKLENINGEDVKVIKVNYQGGNLISVLGSDFRENATISIGDVVTIPYTDMAPNLPNKLTFKMPAVPDTAVGTLHRVVVQNEDKAFAASDDIKLEYPIYIMFTKGETDQLSIESVTPDSGPSTGGTRVEIAGKDFRKTLEGYDDKIKIYFGDGDNQVLVPDGNIISVETTKIVLTTPAHAPGKVTIKIINPDGNIAELSDAYTFVSNPKINGVFDTSEDAKRITTISIDGGEAVKITGSDFVEGAKVVFAPVLEEVKGDDATGNIITIDGKKYILKSGTEATEVTVVDSQNITLKTPAGNIGDKGVIVINPDNAATNIYEGITYTLSKIPAPGNVKAELVNDDKYIRITWDKVDKATEYEVYVVINDNETELIGITELTSYIYEDLESDTKYKFIVKALGESGLSKASMTSNTVETGRHPGREDKDGELGENTSIAKVGETVLVSIGKDIKDKEMKIDLTKGALAGSKEVTVSMPASIVASYTAKDITVIGQDFVAKFNPSAFNVAKIEENKKKGEAGVQFKIALQKEKATNALSNEYILAANAFVGKENSEIDYLKAKVAFTLDYDTSKADLRRMKNVSLYRHEAYNNSWTFIKDRTDEYSAAIQATVDRLGRYSILGSRR